MFISHHYTHRDRQRSYLSVCVCVCVSAAVLDPNLPPSCLCIVKDNTHSLSFCGLLTVCVCVHVYECVCKNAYCNFPFPTVSMCSQNSLDLSLSSLLYIGNFKASWECPIWTEKCILIMLPTQIILVQCKNNPSQTHAVLQFQNIANYQAQ